MQKNENIVPRKRTEEEKANRDREIFDSFANYLTFCPACGHVDRTNMYLMRAEERLQRLTDTGTKCPSCGKTVWEIGYPSGTSTGFVDF